LRWCRFAFEKQAVTARCFYFCSAVLLMANAAYGGGAYQRTKDGRTLVWNNYPTPVDEATWSGKQDANGYATGYGTLTWFRFSPANVTGSNIPSAKRGNVVVGRYSGKMVRGKFDGSVVNVDADGKTFHGTYVNGRKTANWVAGPAAAPVQQSRENAEEGAVTKAPVEGPRPASVQPSNKRVEAGPVAKPPAEGPPPAPVPPPNKRVDAGALAKTPTKTGDSQQPAKPTPAPPPVVTGSSPQVFMKPAPSLPSSSPPAVDPAVKDRMIADFKEQTEAVLSRVGDATENFHEIDRLDSLKPLPGSVSESVDALVDRARDFRSELGYETALQECRSETATVDALAAVDYITRNIASNNAARAGSRLAVFLKNNPEPTADHQKALWNYLTSVQSLCSRLEKDASVHVERAMAFASESKTSEAIREYEEAYRTFPDPAVAEKIRQLQDDSLGL
jgi:hypothetical protein